MPRRLDAKTNAMRALEQRRIPYEAHTYDPEIKSAQGVAEVLGVSPSEVFKTLVMSRDGGGLLLVMVPGDREVDLRTLARAIGSKSVRMTSQAEAEAATGLQTGGIGALALLDRRFEVLIDRSALEHDRIYVNGGRRGLNLRLSTGDLLRLTRARAVDVWDAV